MKRIGAKNIQLAARLIFSMVMIYFVGLETGLATAISIALIWVSMEWIGQTITNILVCLDIIAKYIKSNPK